MAHSTVERRIVLGGDQSIPSLHIEEDANIWSLSQYPSFKIPARQGNNDTTHLMAWNYSDIVLYRVLETYNDIPDWTTHQTSKTYSTGIPRVTQSINPDALNYFQLEYQPEINITISIGIKESHKRSGCMELRLTKIN